MKKILHGNILSVMHRKCAFVAVALLALASGATAAEDRVVTLKADESPLGTILNAKDEVSGAYAGVLSAQNPSATWRVLSNAAGRYRFIVHYSAIKAPVPVVLEVGGSRHELILKPAKKGGSTAGVLVEVGGEGTPILVRLSLAEGAEGGTVSVQMIQIRHEPPLSIDRSDRGRRVIMPIEPYDPTLVSPSS